MASISPYYSCQDSLTRMENLETDEESDLIQYKVNGSDNNYWVGLGSDSLVGP